jgi:hypothetical protein
MEEIKPSTKPIAPTAPASVTAPKSDTTLNIDLKKPPKEASKSDKKEGDDRLRWFFRAKISGVAGVKSDGATAPAPPSPEPGKGDLQDRLVAQLEELKGLKKPALAEPKIDSSRQALETKLGKSNEKPTSDKKVGSNFVETELAKLMTSDKKVGSNFVETELAKLMAPDNKDGKPPETGEIVIDSTKGDILGVPFIRLSTYQTSTAKFIINDPDDSIRKQLLKHSKIEIEAGFVNGFKINKFVGVLFAIGRKFPDGTEVEAVDTSQKMATGAPAIQAPGGTEEPLKDEKTDERISSTFEGEAIFMGGGVGMTATHATLPLTSRVRITNTANNKTAIVTINDKSIGPGGWVLELSKDAAKAMGMTGTGAIRVKGEVMETELEKEAREKKEGKPKTAAPVVGKTDASKTDAPKVDRKPLAPSATADTEKKKEKPTSTQPTTPTFNAASANFEADMAKLGDRNPKDQILNTEVFTKATDLKVSDKSLFKLTGAGKVAMSQTMLEATQKDAALKGQTVIARGNTVTQAAPGTGTPSGVVLDYQKNRAAFIDVNVKRRMGVQLQSGYGAITVKGFNVNDKTMVSATAVSTQPPKQHPTGVIQAPEWGTIKLADPIIPGSPYTWAIATRNGERVPTKEVMGQIIKICQVITPLTAKSVGAGKSWNITSWYRDPAANAAAGGAAQSYHLQGGAVDFYYETNGGEMALYRELEGSYDGGLAVCAGSFVHIDVGARGRWNY